jgi:hypothetical protein
MFSRKWLVIAFGLASFVVLILAASVVLCSFFGNPPPINSARWLLWSRSYKAKVLAQPDSANGEFKHIEWDGWGWAGIDTTVYLVFDPTDSLSRANGQRPGKYSGLPCEVPLVKRLEDKWYTVRFYTNHDWRSGC